MCGFAGIINGTRDFNRVQLNAYARKVSFRGPDSCGVRILNNDLNAAEEGRHALFFNRLAIVDIDPRSDQPFEDERFTLVFNGEIYNYKEIRRTLESDGLIFHTTSDTEVLFNALKHWGTGALEKLNGMFAFCWIDKHTRQFTVARDRLGIKPLYFCKKAESFYFASEIHSILRLSGEVPEISPEAAEMYLWMQFVPTPFSIFKGIFKLPPGNYISGSIDGDKQGLQPRAFWDAYSYMINTPVHQEKDIESILKNSLERQLHADVPLGLFLSSGVDSSLIAAMVNKYFAADKKVNFFTVQFEEETLTDESSDALDFIRGFNNPRLNCQTIKVKPQYIQEHIDELYDYFDEPFGDHASLLNWVISKKAREHVTVAISGDGADELFWGYDRYNRWQHFTKNNSIPLISPLARTVAGMLTASTFANNAIFALEKDPVKRHFNFFLPSGMRFKIRRPITRYPMWALDGLGPLSQRPDLPAILDIKTYLSDAMLYKVDRSSMASSLEVRVPYLDNEMLEYALSLPLAAKSNSTFRNKAPLKELLIKLAPHYNINKPKKGFNFPLRKWLKEHWKEQVLSTVDKEGLESAGLDPDPYLRLVKEFYTSDTPYFTDVWYIFNLMLWMKSIKKIQPAISYE